MASTNVASPEANKPNDRPMAGWAIGLGRTFRRVAIFEIAGTRARLTSVHGMGQPALGKSISLLEETPLRWAIAAASPLVGAGNAPGGSVIAATLGLSTPRAYAVIPLVIKGRLTALAYADQAGEPLPLASTAELFAYCDRLLSGQRPAPVVRPTWKSTSSRPLNRGYRPLLLLRAEPIETGEPETTPGRPTGDPAEPTSTRPIGFTRPRLLTPPPLPADALTDEAPTIELPPVAPNATAPATPAEVAPTIEKPNQAAEEHARPAAVTGFVVTTEGVLTEPDAEPLTEPTPRRRHVLRAVAMATLLLLVGGAAGATWWLAPVSGQREGQRVVHIPPETSVSAMAELLGREQLIREPKTFTLLARLTGVDRKLRAGVYLLPTGGWAWQVLEELHRGQVHTKSITIPEGLTLAEMAELLEAEGLARATDILREAHEPELLAELGLSGATLEGFLFPETYTLAKGLTAREILRVMANQFFAELDKIPAAHGLKAEKLHELVTLASVVEREARDRTELAKVAGVFTNRLERNMRLESCATVQYLLGTPKARLTLADVRRESPYNTYLNPGLPPGPIANPGRGALIAAAMPERHDFLFFFAREDGSHQHEFSRTYAAHQEKQRKGRRRN